MNKLPPLIPTLAEAHKELNSTIGKLLAAFKISTSEARDYTQIKDDPDESFFAHQVRYLLKVELHREGIEAEDECELEKTSNTGICMNLPGFRIRVLRDTKSGNLPDTDSERRKRFLGQVSEQFRLFSAEETENIEEGDEREPTHVVFLWGTDSKRRFTGLWFICPNGISSAPHFQEWIQLPGLAEAPMPPQGPAPEMPPSNLGLTKKKDASTKKGIPKTGTDSKDK